ncbi:MAG: purine-nucleoside phosphorylase [Desulfamplus sp.]|nr:purine-nucleoside phosphorylase [Desulfamplus sp.]
MSFPTWSDLNDESLIPPLGVRYAPDMGQDAVMISTRPDVTLAESFGGDLKSGDLKNSVPFFCGQLFTLENGITVAGPYLGAPWGAMALESLIARGVSRVVALGWCGAIWDGLQIGDVIMPDRAVSDEGTSRNYMEMPMDSDFPLTFPSDELSRNVALTLHKDLKSHNPNQGDLNPGHPNPGHLNPGHLNSGNRNSGNINSGNINSYNFQINTGTIWTTDAIYRETSKKVAFFRNMDAVAVEMECSALFSVAAYRKIDLTAVLIVSDTLFKNEWNPGFRSRRFKKSRTLVIDSLLTGGWRRDAKPKHTP